MIQNLDQIEKNLEANKRAIIKENWDNYLIKLKVFLDKLIGKVLITHYSNGQFYMFKVLGYNKRVKFNEKNQHIRYYEIVSTGYLNFTVPNTDGRIYKHNPAKITENVWFNDGINVPYGCTRLVVKKGKHKDQLIFPKFIVDENSISNSSDGTLHELTSVGMEVVDGNYPNYDTSMNKFIGHNRIVTNTQVFDKAMELHQKQTLEVLEFWNSFKADLTNLTHVNDDCTIIK